VKTDQRNYALIPDDDAVEPQYVWGVKRSGECSDNTVSIPPKAQAISHRSL
jgi:hypothetical protein